MLLCLASRKNVHHIQLFHSTFYELKKNAVTPKNTEGKSKTRDEIKTTNEPKIRARLTNNQVNTNEQTCQ